MKTRVRFKILCDGVYYYSKADFIEDYDTLSEQFYANNVGALNKFMIIGEDGSHVFFNSEAAKRCVITLEKLEE